MRVYGLDFTSSPKKGKPLTLAECTLEGNSLCVERFRELGDNRTRPLADYMAWLRSEGRWQKENNWIAGIDFPFGMPVAAIFHFEWGTDSDETSWERYIRQLYEKHTSFTDFIAAIKGWAYPNEVSDAGNRIKVQFKRVTDQVAHSHSPMKVSDNPYPGAMFYQGCKGLLEANIRVPPMRNDGTPHKIAVEAYPRLVAQRFFPAQPAFNELVANKQSNIDLRKKTPKTDVSTKVNLRAVIAELTAKARLSLRYKEAGSDPFAETNRRLIVDGLSRPDNPYGVHLVFRDNNHKDACIRDQKADCLDSVLCAVQAAWAYGLRDGGYGIPQFSTMGLLARQIALEGWIVDPAMQSVLRLPR